jgi:hypothetical protein
VNSEEGLDLSWSVSRNVRTQNANFRNCLGPIPTPAVWLGIQRTGREAKQSPSSVAEVNNIGAIPPLPNTSSQRGA